MRLLIRSVLGSAILLAGAAQAGSVATIDRTEYFNAPAHCQGALPSFDDSLRKRPLALQNEGTDNAFVTCVVPTPGHVTALEVYVSSHDSVAAQVTCTAVSGFKGGDNMYVPKTVTTSAEGAWTGFVWMASDFDAAIEIPSGFIALSCNLAPGTGLNDFWLNYVEELG